MPPQPPPPGAELVVDRVSRTYPGGVRALDEVSLRLAPGELVLLSGRSGAGKSTLLNLVAALDRPESGRILVDGVSLDELPDLARYRREVVGFVFQLHHLIDALTAEENVEVPLLPAGGPARDRVLRVRKVLDQVGMGGRERHLPDELSGGERQRVAIARALVNRPRLLLADEPTANLDEESAEELLSLLAELSEVEGKTILLVSHDPSALPRANRMIRLRDGRVEPSGTGNGSVSRERPQDGGE